MRMRSLVIALGLTAAALLWVRERTLAPPPVGGAPPAPPTAKAPVSSLLLDARALVDDARFPEALALLAERGDEARAELPALALWIDLERHLGDPARAVELAELASDTWPGRPEAWLALARALGSRMQAVRPRFLAVRWLGAWHDAVDRALAVAPHDREAWVTQIGFLVYAPSLVGGDPDEALRLCDEFASHEPAAAAMMRALALDASGEPGAGLAVAREAAALAPDDQDLGIVHGSLAAAAGRSDEAVAAFDRVLAGPQGPAWYRALYYRARERILQRQELERAAADLERFLGRAPPADYMPTRAEAFEQLGRAWERLDRRQDALLAYERALDEEPDRESAARAVERLR